MISSVKGLSVNSPLGIASRAARDGCERKGFIYGQALNRLLCIVPAMQENSIDPPLYTLAGHQTMNEMLAERKRPQSLGEEISNAVSHAVGLIATLLAAPFLIASTIRHGDTRTILGAGIFAVTVVLLYLASTLYHGLPKSKAKRVFRVLDHGAIFILIAGTYTPFTLGVLRGPWGWTLLFLIWGLAVFGVTAKAVWGIRNPHLSTGLYLAMGWLIIIAIRPLWFQMPSSGILWLLAGGIAYTSGVAFFAYERVRYTHFVWHLFVIAGTACHYFAVLWYA
jgi:hemolysin III